MSKCDICIHKEVCHLKDKYQGVVRQIEGIILDVFSVEVKCPYYQELKVIPRDYTPYQPPQQSSGSAQFNPLWPVTCGNNIDFNTKAIL